MNTCPPSTELGFPVENGVLGTLEVPPLFRKKKKKKNKSDFGQALHVAHTDSQRRLSRPSLGETEYALIRPKQLVSIPPNCPRAGVHLFGDLRRRLWTPGAERSLHLLPTLFTAWSLLRRLLLLLPFRWRTCAPRLSLRHPLRTNIGKHQQEGNTTVTHTTELDHGGSRTDASGTQF